MTFFYANEMPNYFRTIFPFKQKKTCKRVELDLNEDKKKAKFPFVIEIEKSMKLNNRNWQMNDDQKTFRYAINLCSSRGEKEEDNGGRRDM